MNNVNNNMNNVINVNNNDIAIVETCDIKIIKNCLNALQQMNKLKDRTIIKYNNLSNFTRDNLPFNYESHTLMFNIAIWTDVAYNIINDIYILYNLKHLTKVLNIQSTNEQYAMMKLKYNIVDDNNNIIDEILLHLSKLVISYDMSIFIMFIHYSSLSIKQIVKLIKIIIDYYVINNRTRIRMFLQTFFEYAITYQGLPQIKVEYILHEFTISIMELDNTIIELVYDQLVEFKKENILRSF